MSETHPLPVLVITGEL